jgi:hypothetical protein
MSSVNQNVVTREPVYTFPEVFEIVERILLSLSHKDIVRASGVCNYWRSCIKGSKPLLRKTHQLATPISDDENPHFEGLIDASKEAVIPRGRAAGRNLWQYVRDVEDKYIASLHEKPEAVDEKPEREDKQEDEREDKQENEREDEQEDDQEDEEEDEQEDEEEDEDDKKLDFHQTFWRKMRDLRCGMKDIRYVNNLPVGWPIGLRELHCDLCDKWHTNFKFENLHPLFQFLGEMTMCFRGSGAQLMIDLAIVSEKMAPAGCWKHSCEEALMVARALKKAYEAVQSGGVAQDFFARPVVTKLVTSDGWTIEDENGLTLEKVTPFVLRLYRGELLYWRWHCHGWEFHRVERWSRARRNTAHTYPTPEDWDLHMANYSNITAMWEDMVTEVDAMMSDVASWEPVMAQIIEFEEVHLICLG